MRVMLLGAVFYVEVSVVRQLLYSYAVLVSLYGVSTV